MFGTNPLKKAAPDTENEKKLSTVLRKAWATFAKDPVHGLETFGWPKYDKTRRFCPFHYMDNING